jgi:hypothetical protein
LTDTPAGVSVERGLDGATTYRIDLVCGGFPWLVEREKQDERTVQRLEQLRNLASGVVD